MTVGAGGGRVIELVLFALAIAIGSEALAAPRAAELGPEAVLAEPSGGFVGRLSVKPEHGPVGTPLEVTGDGFPAEQEIELVWRTVKGRWKVTTSEYHGREYTPIAYRIGIVTSDKAGRITASFSAPEDFGFLHDIVAQQDKRLLMQTAFNLDMTVKTPTADRLAHRSPLKCKVSAGANWRGVGSCSTTTSSRASSRR